LAAQWQSLLFVWFVWFVVEQDSACGALWTGELRAFLSVGLWFRILRAAAAMVEVGPQRT
jgi:hypothetical protein